MTMGSMAMPKQIQPWVNIPATGGGGGCNMQLRLPPQPLQKEKVVVVMGATGTGKSRFSIDLATRFPAEVVNSDKIQLYQGLEIATNKITEEEQRGVPHHLLGLADPNADFPVQDFCNFASLAVRSIAGRGQLPIIVGGSNSYIEALVDDQNREFRSRYECCFLWVDVSIPVLTSFVSERVDRMIDAGMVEEVREMFDPAGDYSRGIRRAIGVPEFHPYFKLEHYLSEEARKRLLKEVIREIKNNTCKLACRQLEKIYRLRNVKGWKLHRLNATDVFLKQGKEADEAWEKLVAGPGSTIVSRFLYNIGPRVHGKPAAIREAAAAAAMGTTAAMAVAATR